MIKVLQENALFASAILFVLLLILYSAFYPHSKSREEEKEKSKGKGREKGKKGSKGEDSKKASTEDRYKNKFVWWIVYFVVGLGVTYGLYILYMKYFKYKMMTGGGSSAQMHYRNDLSNLNMFGDDVDVGFLE
jgi:hypothetical protein